VPISGEHDDTKVAVGRDRRPRSPGQPAWTHRSRRQHVQPL